MKKMFAINFYPLDCDKILSFTKQDYYWPKSSHLNYFEKPYILPLKEELHVEKNIVIEDYVKVKEQNIEISKEILAMEENPQIKTIVKENNEDPITKKDLDVEMVETIEEEIEEESFKNLNEIKSYDCQSQVLLFWW